MAALEYGFPWIDSMSPSSHHHHHQNRSSGNGSSSSQSDPPTVAAFSPTTLSGSSLTSSKSRSSLMVHRKSPLLVATPPEVTRALAYSHPFILPLNTLAGLLTWSTGDPWQSFLFLAGYWTIVLYSDVVILWAGPVVVVGALILSLYSRRYSPLSSTVPDPNKAAATRQHKSLDEIVETMRTFTTRCNLLLDPFVEFTDYLTTQMTPTSTSTRPPLTALIIRIIFATPIWILLSLPPVSLITTRRVVAMVGTIFIAHHSRPARVARVMLWRSLTVRRICSMITGLQFSSEVSGIKPFSYDQFMDLVAKRSGQSPGIRFTFALYENQRRWLGVGWTYSLLPTERAPWTDEFLNPVPPKDEFELPDTHSGTATWRWVEGSEWHVEGIDDAKADAKSSDGAGWYYSDNKWNNARLNQDGWDRYTRRRKWCRAAELVETTPNLTETSSRAPSSLALALREQGLSGSNSSSRSTSRAASPTPSVKRRKKWFGHGHSSKGEKGESDKTSRPSSPPHSKHLSLDLPRILPPIITGHHHHHHSSGPKSASLSGPKSPSISRPFSISAFSPFSPSVKSSSPNSPRASYTGSNAGRDSLAGSNAGRDSFGGSMPGRDSYTGSNAGRDSFTSGSPWRDSYNYTGSYPGREISNAGSYPGRETSNTGSYPGREISNSLPGSDTLSLREKEISQAQDHLDHWGTRATGATERAEREMGLGDDVNMGLS